MPDTSSKKPSVMNVYSSIVVPNITNSQPTTAFPDNIRGRCQQQTESLNLLDSVLGSLSEVLQPITRVPPPTCTGQAIEPQSSSSSVLAEAIGLNTARIRQITATIELIRDHLDL